jgi:hypothetical protein
MHRLNATQHHYPQHAKARREAFGWYHAEPPSPEVAHSHFLAKAKHDPANRSIYEEALDIFLGTCWKTRAPNR